MSASERYYRAKHRSLNALRDFWDRWARGLCCAAPRFIVDGGYYFWRCSLRRGHKGPHRSVNYLWGDAIGGSAYSPVDAPTPMLDRYPSRTRRQRREWDAWHA